jgi:ubiquitin-like modifier-activating enzyme ATG7
MFVKEKIESHEETKDKLLQFLPFSSVVESSFWHKLSLLKIDVYALKDEPVDIQGYYTAARLPAFLNVDYSWFDK